MENAALNSSWGSFQSPPGGYQGSASAGCSGSILPGVWAAADTARVAGKLMLLWHYSM